MKGFMKRVDLFCYKHPRFGINNLMMIICIANIAVWLFSAMDTTGLLRNYLAFNARDVLYGQIWRLITFVFIPEYTSPFSLLISLYFYYFIGSTLERQWGPGRFTIYYLCGMLLQVIYGLIIYLATGISYSMTANYINLSMFFAFATLYPDNTVLLFFIIPIKMKWLAIVDALFFVYSIFSNLGAGMGLMSFLPLVAILNYFLFCGDILFGSVLPRGRKQRRDTVDFKREVRKIQHEQRNKNYTRKCEVCGRTDTDYPDLEFRYCSRCAGYHCFCQDHINNHIHFTE